MLIYSVDFAQMVPALDMEVYGEQKVPQSYEILQYCNRDMTAAIDKPSLWHRQLLREWENWPVLKIVL